jgi:hypothetical protein
MALLLGCGMAAAGCGNSQLENKPNLKPADVPPPAPASETKGASNPTKIAQ